MDDRLHPTNARWPANGGIGTPIGGCAARAPAGTRAAEHRRPRRRVSLDPGDRDPSRRHAQRALGRDRVVLGAAGVIVKLWGTRGSLASSGPDTVRYGGNTASVEVCGGDGAILALDAGTGIRRLGATIDPSIERVDVLLTHLHMDHIQGLGFFAPFFRAGGEVHLWGPPSPTIDLRSRLTRY